MALLSRSGITAGLRELWLEGTTGGTVTVAAGIDAFLAAEWPALDALQLDRFALGDGEAARLAAGFAARGRKSLEMNSQLSLAGMRGTVEAALASVVGGLVKAPVIAVPTSVGYGASFNGLAPLLSMLNSCASGVGVVNIDNGFAAGYLASMINAIGEKRPV